MLLNKLASLLNSIYLIKERQVSQPNTLKLITYTLFKIGISLSRDVTVGSLGLHVFFFVSYFVAFFFTCWLQLVSTIFLLKRRKMYVEKRGWSRNFIQISSNNQQQQQQLSRLSQVFGVGCMNQKRITPVRAHRSAFSTHSYQAIWLH